MAKQAGRSHKRRAAHKASLGIPAEQQNAHADLPGEGAGQRSGMEMLTPNLIAFAEGERSKFTPRSWRRIEHLLATNPQLRASVDKHRQQFLGKQGIELGSEWEVDCLFKALRPLDLAHSSEGSSVNDAAPGARCELFHLRDSTSTKA